MNTAHHKAIRERFQKEKPTLEQLVASGEYNEPLPMGEYLSIRVAVSALKKAREAGGCRREVRHRQVCIVED